MSGVPMPEEEENELDVVDLCVGFGLLIAIPVIVMVVMKAGFGLSLSGDSMSRADQMRLAEMEKERRNLPVPLTKKEFVTKVDRYERVIDQNLTTFLGKIRVTEDLIEKSNWTDLAVSCANKLNTNLEELIVAYDQSSILNQDGKLRQRATDLKARVAQLQSEAESLDSVRQLQNFERRKKEREAAEAAEAQRNN